MTHHLALGVEYVGTNFSGTQLQRNQRTVQLELERAISMVADRPTRINLASRTDRGVHATNLVIGFDTRSFREDQNWLQGINSNLSNDIAVHTSLSVVASFDVRRSSRWRRYLYVFGESDHVPAIGCNLASWTLPGLNVALMDSQAQALLGEHDFTSFRGANCQSRSPQRCIHAISVRRTGCYVVVDIIANAFLMRMVRNISGALLNVGRERGLDLSRLLACRDRNQAPATAPATGLYLVQICYEDYPKLSKFRIPRILGSNVNLPHWESDDFADVRSQIEPIDAFVE